MVTRVYSHILDEDRKTNAQKFNEVFYQPAKVSTDIDASKVMLMIADNPTLLNDLRSLLINTAVL